MKKKHAFIITTILAALLLVVANSAIWVNRNLFNTQQFTAITTDAMLSQSSRTALAGEIVDKALADQPAIRAAAAEPATNFIAGLLNSNQAQTALNRVVSKLQIILTSKRPESITYDLSGIKATIEKLLTLANKEEAVVKVDKVPDTITLFDASKVPSFYQAGVALTLLAPFAALLALFLLAWPHIKKYYPTAKLLTIQGVSLITAGVLALLVGPIFRPPVLAQVNNANLRVVVENVYNAFIQTFDKQTYYLIGLGAILVIIPLGARLYKIVRTTYFSTANSNKTTPKPVASKAVAPKAKPKAKKKK